jgi:hypothetical protein
MKGNDKMKIAINTCYGGFGLSELALIEYKRRANVADHYFFDYDIARDDPNLIDIVEEWGQAACSRYSDLRIVEIPDDVEWQIEEYDGMEWVAEKHRTWS